jgi:two-component system, sensor histidine kinase
MVITGKKILLAEDNDINRMIASIVLKSNGYEITEVLDGKAAVTELTRQSFDLVLMDMQMPFMDGLEATRIIRKHLNSKVPIIALTANEIQKEKGRCVQAGMNDFLMKPFDEKDLVSIIIKWLQKPALS